MLALASALVSNLKLLLLDEALIGLAIAVIKKITDVLKSLCKEGKGILLVEQNIELAFNIADYCYITEKGKITFERTPSGIRSNPTERLIIAR